MKKKTYKEPLLWSIIIILVIFLILSFLILTLNYNSSKIALFYFGLCLVGYLLAFRNFSLLNLSLPASIFLYPAIISLLYLLIEKSSLKDTNELIMKKDYLLFITILLLMLTSGYIPSVNDSNAINIQNTFGNNFAILIAYPLSLMISEYLLVKVYTKLKKIYNSPFLTIIITSSLAITIYLLIYNLIVNITILEPLKLFYSVALSYLIEIILTIIFYLSIISIFPKKKVKK